MRFRLVHHDVVDSTSERAFAALAAGDARDGDVHVARGQSAGRGRRGTAWVSPVDEGLYLSVVLLPGPPPYLPAALTIAAGLAAVEALNSLGLAPFTEDAPRLKWPNDVLVRGAKICGLLAESRALDPAQPHYVLGIGLNVRQRQFPNELLEEQPVTSLARLGRDLSLETAREALLARLGPRLAQVRSDHRRLAEDYLVASDLAERPVVVRCGKECHAGMVRGLSLTEGLELAGADGRGHVLPLELVRGIELRD